MKVNETYVSVPDTEEARGLGMIPGSYPLSQLADVYAYSQKTGQYLYNAKRAIFVFGCIKAAGIDFCCDEAARTLGDTDPFCPCKACQCELPVTHPFLCPCRACDEACDRRNDEDILTPRDVDGSELPDLRSGDEPNRMAHRVICTCDECSNIEPLTASEVAEAEAIALVLNDHASYIRKEMARALANIEKCEEDILHHQASLRNEEEAKASYEARVAAYKIILKNMGKEVKTDV